MAQNPVFWALGIAVFVACAALTSVDRLSGGRDSPRAAAMTQTEAPPRQAQGGVPARPGNPTLTVSADYRGHYLVHPTIENYRLTMMVDSGASVVALTARDARALGFNLRPGDYRMAMNTANGVVRGARVNLREIRLGDILVRNVEAVVLPEGVLSISLLGTSFLGKLRGYEVQAGKMILRG